ncbi:MAG: SCP2 sterol-binding domain-containing protein, partial [Candidatus Helarchaeota archaeon]
MAVFKDSEELKNVLIGFFNKIASNEAIALNFVKSKLVIRFNYREPDLSLTLDMSSGKDLVITVNDKEKVPEVDMDMKADIAHKFWLGKLNLTMAITRRQMVVHGPVPKILAFLP